ncbi:MAG: GntR family transcriptional regulator [Clostridiales Family XIII bacterium]|jgi:DNA-binding GntR family transcriptional regulator|nr:GntR family transcriptional regulator [Clostridiales Family XIII bacterium]
MDNHTARSIDLAEKIRIEILSERLIPGTKLTETALAEDYGVSRTPIREALKNLEAEGLIEMIPNRGAFVVGLSEDDIRDLYSLRRSCECRATKWAINRRTDEEFDHISESFEFMVFYTSRGDGKRMRSINAGFHHRIATASHSRMLIGMIEQFQEYIRYSAKVLPYKQEDLPIILAEHKAIYDAFVENDADAGERAMREHIIRSLERSNL